MGRGKNGEKKDPKLSCSKYYMSWSVTCIFCRWSKYNFNAFHTMKELFFSRKYLQNWILCLFWSRFVFVKDAHARLKHHNILLCYLYCYWPAGRHLVSCCAGIKHKKLSRSSLAYQTGSCVTNAILFQQTTNYKISIHIHKKVSKN